jgi:hypothetical protein
MGSENIFISCVMFMEERESTIVLRYVLQLFFSRKPHHARNELEHINPLSILINGMPFLVNEIIVFVNETTTLVDKLAALIDEMAMLIVKVSLLVHSL